MATGVECSVCYLEDGLSLCLRSPRHALAVLASLVFLTLSLSAQKAAGPMPVPLPPPIIAPVDTPYVGTIVLSVDASNVNDRIFTVHETIPVKGKAVTLLYPLWIPGTHSPSNPVIEFAGLVITSNGKTIPWVRDRVQMSAFHVDVPAGVTSLEANFQFLAQLDPKRSRISDNFADLTWQSVLLYPAGYFSRDINFSPTLKLPDGWKFACALETKSQQGSTVAFKDTTLNTLIDSPLYAGVNFKRVDLSTGPDNQVFFDIFADKPADLEITPEELQFHKNLVVAGAEAFQLASLRSLRFPVLGKRHRQRQGAGASSVERGRHARELLHRLDGRSAAGALFCRTNTRTRGTENSAARPTCGRRTSMSPCRTICCGSMKA